MILVCITINSFNAEKLVMMNEEIESAAFSFSVTDLFNINFDPTTDNFCSFIVDNEKQDDEEIVENAYSESMFNKLYDMLTKYINISDIEQAASKETMQIIEQFFDSIIRKMLKDLLQIVYEIKDKYFFQYNEKQKKHIIENLSPKINRCFKTIVASILIAINIFLHKTRFKDGEEQDIFPQYFRVITYRLFRNFMKKYQWLLQDELFLCKFGIEQYGIKNSASEESFLNAIQKIALLLKEEDLIHIFIKDDLKEEEENNWCYLTTDTGEPANGFAKDIDNEAKIESVMTLILRKLQFDSLEEGIKARIFQEFCISLIDATFKLITNKIEWNLAEKPGFLKNAKIKVVTKKRQWTNLPENYDMYQDIYFLNRIKIFYKSAFKCCKSIKDIFLQTINHLPKKYHRYASKELRELIEKLYNEYVKKIQKAENYHIKYTYMWAEKNFTKQ